MATILPFPAPRGGDWTASERAGLDELAARFASEAGIEVAFGRTDAGDPWCVVLDARDEVLVHVAREGRDFVAHTADDLFVRSGDLRTAVERVLGSRWQEERAEVVVPFAAAGRSTQVVTAVLVVASFVHHYRAEAEPADDWSFAARPLKAGGRDNRDQAAKTVVPLDVDPVIYHATGVPVPQSAEAVASPFGVPSDPLTDEPAPGVHHEPSAPGLAIAAKLIEAVATIRGTTGVDHLMGTDGDDLLDGATASPRAHDLLDAGTGNDTLIIHENTVAIGGDGADRFVVRAPETPSATNLLGVLLDFDPGTDSIVSGTPGHTTVTVLNNIPLPDIFADPGVGFAVAPVLPGNRLTVDLDGDAKPDGYLLVNAVTPDATVLDAVRDVFTPAPPDFQPPVEVLPMPLPLHIEPAMIVQQPEII